jgi:pimeloyl-ACP methyl ester carboxylesterase
MSVREEPGCFLHEGRRLAYRVYGEGPRVTVLLHGLLFSQRMHVPLARALAERGNRVVTLDVRGHGSSDRPTDMQLYGMSFFAQDVVALLDHLEIDEAVVGGTSLGANTTLEMASLAPLRLRGMILEMPVLDNALLACAVAFTPVLVALTIGEPVMNLVSRVARLIPERRVPWAVNVLLDTLRQSPAPSAAVVQGVFAGRTAPHHTERRTFTTPALVIGHRRDPVHPFSDAGLLAEELPNARLLEANSMCELRVAPDRLTDEIAAFVERCWKPRPAQRARRGTAPA